LKKKYILWAVLGVIAALVLFLGKTKWGREIETFQEVKVEKGHLTISVESTATVNPQNRLEIKPPIAGRVDKVMVKEGEHVSKGKVLAWISSNERAALLDSVRALGSEEMKKWEELYRPTPVVAPIQGTIILRNIETGQSFTNADSIFTMADRLTVKAQVDETDIAQVKIGQEAQITLDAYPDKPVSGKVVHIAYDATITNNVTTYIVDILPSHVPEFMRSGMTCNVSIKVSSTENVLLLPLTALVLSPQGPQVRVRNKDSKIILKSIKTGLDDQKKIEIVTGLVSGEVVLVEVNEKEFGKLKTSSPFMPKGPKGHRR
jgi:membrane fusion protein, macrolide-specific efflux system